VGLQPTDEFRGGKPGSTSAVLGWTAPDGIDVPE
jgi:hypothetical protein